MRLIESLDTVASTPARPDPDGLEAEGTVPVFRPGCSCPGVRRPAPDLVRTVIPTIRLASNATVPLVWESRNCPALLAVVIATTQVASVRA